MQNTKNKYYILFSIGLIGVLVIVFLSNFFSSKEIAVKKNKPIERIISLSPSITETLFALDLGDKVVGVTRFCNYPPEAKMKKEIGGYLDINYEGIVALTPDLVILLPEHEKAQKYLKELGINYLEVNNKTIADIIKSIGIIGDKCNATKKAKELSSNIELNINNIKQKVKNLKKPKVIISVGRTVGTGKLKDVYLAGSKTYFSELIEIAGGINAYKSSNIDYPKLTAEGIIHLNPDIIIDLVADIDKRKISKRKVLKEWNSLGRVNAVLKKNVFVLSSDYCVIPGPRFVLLLNDLVKAIHPEIYNNKIEHLK